MGIWVHLRRALLNVDAACAAGVGLRQYRRWAAARLQARIASHGGLVAYAVHYPKQSLSSFAKLCDHHGSDKGTRGVGPHPYAHSPHSYADFYASLFEHCRHSVRQVFECGLGTNNPAVPSNMGVTGRPGASLRAWRDFFPDAQIYGADIDHTILFAEDRISTFHVDQTSIPSIAAMWAAADIHGLDLIVDDGLHTFDAGVTFFEQTFCRLRPGGIYVIEDVTPQSLERFVAYFARTAYEVSYVTFRGPDDPGFLSSLVVIRHG